MKNHYRGVISMAALALALLTASIVAQGQDYKVGDRVEVDVIMQRDPQYSVYKKGTVVGVDQTDKSYIVAVDPLPGGLPQNMRMPVRDYGPHWIRAVAGADNAPKVLSEKLRTDENGTVLAGRELLDCRNLSHDGSNGAPPPVELAKKLIRCLYERPSAPGQDGATTGDITDLTIGAPHRWNRYQDIGQGNAGTLVYPVHVKWTQKTFFRTRNVVTTDSEGTFTCFTDTTNLWQCGSAAGPHKDGKVQQIMVTR